MRVTWFFTAPPPMDEAAGSSRPVPPAAAAVWGRPVGVCGAFACHKRPLFALVVIDCCC